MSDSSPQSSQGQPPLPAIPPPGHALYYVPDEPPPSYDDATHSSSTPLLVGPPPDYGTAYSTYAEPDASSTASSDADTTSRSLPEWVGQALVVFCFVAIIYGFFTLVNDPPDCVGC